MHRGPGALISVNYAGRDFSNVETCPRINRGTDKTTPLGVRVVYT